MAMLMQFNENDSYKYEELKKNTGERKSLIRYVVFILNIQLNHRNYGCSG